jgi:endonuclease/exonuclease/phosphatase family metal-dependent hydrolase
MNGVAASVEKYDAKNNIYIAYSDSIPVTEFGIPYSIVLSNGSAMQTVTYSINSYAYTKLSSTNEAMVELAKATYTYGDSAKKYAGYSDTVYTVITYNDADNNAPYEDNYNEVAQIIKDCNPDLVGMQEIQGKPLLGGVSHDEKFRELFADMGYGWIWNSRGYSVGGEHELGERFSPSGVAIAYRLDKFELLETKHFWLSDTPTVASKYEESDYTHDFVTALLKDKITGETFLFVNAHTNYKAKANVKQIAKLLALVEDELDGHMHYSSYRKIYTADWNFGDPGLESAGAKLFNEAGYYTTDTLMGNVYKPSTTVNGAYIDCCFVDPDEFKPIKYKVINDHQYSLTTSDHYPVFSKIVWPETYEDVLLEAINEFPRLPDDPTYNDHNDFFFSEEDTDGFIYG